MAGSTAARTKPAATGKKAVTSESAGGAVLTARARTDAVAPPPRAAALPAPIQATQASVNRYLAAYIMGIANRLANGASNHYRKGFNLGMSEWRAMMAIGENDGSIVRQVAEMADLDYAAASKSVRLLEQRGLVTVEQTQSRGRAAIVRATPEGSKLYRRLRASAQRRQARLVSAFTPAEIEALWGLLRRVEQQVPHMNGD